MGKVRPASIKRLAYQIFQQYYDRVSLDYAQNKKLVLEVSTTRAKHLLNRVSGYLTKLAKRYKAPEVAAQAKA
ncbi:MAG: 30S ribosomal protein S17e [Candidatus Verstraetearchaeota archaeon]|jgi:small subunit ribosomal protein S17e|nr:30S ribosomal protein S17e [Candidatus Verstraetearchaeota archaeon]NHW44667.1 30S ribosomal protein S17e [Candidatus Verstraetearchaeota archaeon]